MASIGELIGGAGVATRTWDEMDRQKAFDDFLNRQRAYQGRLMDTEEGLLPTRAANEQAALGVATARSRAALGQVGQEAANRAKQLGIEGAQLDIRAKPENLATEGDTYSSALQAQRNQAKLALQQSGLELDKWPSVLKQAKANQLVNDQTAGLMLTGGLGLALLHGEDKPVLDYANAALDQGWLPQVPPGSKVVAFHPVQTQASDAKGQPLVQNGQPVMQVTGYQFVTDKGQTVTLDANRVWDAYRLTHPAQMMKLSKGEAIGSVGPMGDVRVSAAVPEWTAPNAEGQSIEQTTGQVKQIPMSGFGPRMRALVDQAVHHLDTTLGANGFNKMDPHNEPAYTRMSKRAEELVVGGMMPQAAGNKAWEEYRSAEATAKATGQPAGGAVSSPVENVLRRFGVPGYTGQ